MCAVRVYITKRGKEYVHEESAAVDGVPTKNCLVQNLNALATCCAIEFVFFVCAVGVQIAIGYKNSSNIDQYILFAKLKPISETSVRMMIVCVVSTSFAICKNSNDY